MPLPRPVLRSPRASDDRDAACVLPWVPSALARLRLSKRRGDARRCPRRREPEFRGRGLLIGIDVDDIKVGDILTTGQTSKSLVPGASPPWAAA